MPEKASSKVITLIALDITSVTTGLMLLLKGSLTVSEWLGLEGVSSSVMSEATADMVDRQEYRARAASQILRPVRAVIDVFAAHSVHCISHR